MVGLAALDQGGDRNQRRRWLGSALVCIFEACLRTDTPVLRDRVCQRPVGSTRLHILAGFAKQKTFDEILSRPHTGGSWTNAFSISDSECERWALLAAMRSRPTSQLDTCRTKIMKFQRKPCAMLLRDSSGR